MPSTRVSCWSGRARTACSARPSGSWPSASPAARSSTRSSPTAPHGRPVARHRPVAPAGRPGRHPDRPAGPPAPAGGPGPGHPVAGPGPRRLRAVHARREPACPGARWSSSGAVEIVAGNRRLATFRPPGWRAEVGPAAPAPCGPLSTGLAAVCLAAVAGRLLDADAAAHDWRRGRSRRCGRPPSGWPTTSPATGSWSSTTASGPTWSTTTASTRSPSSSTSSTPTRRSASTLRRIDYLVLPNWYYATPTGVAKYPTA